MPSAPRPVILSDPRQVSELMRCRREALGLTPEDVANALWLSPSAVTSAETSPPVIGKWFTATAVWWARALGLELVLMDKAEARRLVAESTGDPMTEAPHRAYAGRTKARTPIKRTELRMQVTFTTLG